MTGKRESKKRALRKALYDAAFGLIERNGYDAVSIEQIVAAAGVAKGTFFNHFPGKADLLAEWYARAMQTAFEKPVPATPGTLPVGLSALVLNSLDAASAAPEMWRAKNALALSTPSIQAAERQVDRDLLAEIERRLSDARTAGFLPHGIDTGALADLVLTLVTGSIREWAVTGAQSDAGELIEQRITRLCELAGYRPLAREQTAS